MIDALDLVQGNAYERRDKMEAGTRNLQKDRQNHSVSNKIQILRGLAIIAVVFIHNTPFGIPQVVFRPFLNFCVGLFLFLSGMLSDAGRWNPKKRISKVLIPYAIWTLIYVCLSEYKTPLLIPVIFIKRLILGNAVETMYYIFVYCEFTLLIPLIDKLARSKYRYWGFAIAPTEIIVMRLIPMLMGGGFNKYIDAVKSVSCFAWFTYFYLGYIDCGTQI
ncbi:MAG: acyltransferase [Lachnospiraceae bacterium]|nr:acyltransferase [Lachnospiraceae bacterium]